MAFRSTDQATQSEADKKRAALLEDELLLIQSSGELPEPALHGSLFYLQEAEDGPRLHLTREERRELEEAAARCYENIIRRDLNLENRDQRRFRGLARAWVNWQRYTRFCARSGLTICSTFQAEAGRALVSYLVQEGAEVARGERDSSINCLVCDLHELATALQTADQLPSGWENLCPQAVES